MSRDYNAFFEGQELNKLIGNLQTVRNNAVQKGDNEAVLKYEKQIEELKAKRTELYAKCKRSSSQTANNNSSSTVTLIEKSGKRKHPFDPENIERCKRKI